MYQTIKNIIISGNTKGYVTIEKLTMLMLTNVITPDEYKELKEMLVPSEVEEPVEEVTEDEEANEEE